MPTAFQYETVKQQTLSFLTIGCQIKFDMEKGYNPRPLVTIFHHQKRYKFSDPDWNIVSRQLNKLYFTIKEKQ